MSQTSSHLPIPALQSTIGHNMGINANPLNPNPTANPSHPTAPNSAPNVANSNQLGVLSAGGGQSTGGGGGGQQVCCLMEDSQRCHRIAGNASYSKRIEKQVTQRKLRLTVDQRSKHSYICEHHKQMIQSIRSSNKRKRKDSEDDNELTIDTDSHIGGQADNRVSGQDVDLLALQVNTLRRYKKHYRIQTRPGLNKSQLAESLQRHFKSMPIYEKEAITYFIYMVKCNKNKLDQNNTGGQTSKQTAQASD